MSDPTRTPPAADAQPPTADHSPAATTPGGRTAVYDGASAPTPTTALPTVPGYEFERELARGGMGAVYLARQTALRRPVAVKLTLAGASASAMDLVRFLAEAEAAAAIDHPHVVRVHDFGRHDGRPYLVMEYMPGGTLADRLRVGPLPAAEAARLVELVARGVAAAHDLGIVHRDIKPGNVLFDADGTPKVADFGLAKRAGGADLTRTHMVMGTPAYMAPEQAAGRARLAGPAADVWALGAVLYHALTGRVPFPGDDPVVVLHRVLTEEPEPPRAVNPAVPRDVDLICRKCLARDPRQRYRTAAELADDLGRFRGGKAVLVRPARAPERAWRWCRRNPAVAALLATVVVASVAGAGVSARYAAAADRRRAEADEARQVAQREKGEADAARQIAQQEREAAEAAREAVQREKTEADASRERAEWAAYVSQISLSQRELELGNTAAATELLAATRANRRGWEFHYLQGLVGRGQTWAIDEPARALTASPDRKRIAAAIGRLPGRIAVYAAADGKREWQTATDAPVNALAFTPDGAGLVTGQGEWLKEVPGAVRLWDAATGRLVRELVTFPRPVMSLAVHPGGTQVFASCENNMVYWIDILSGRIVRSVPTAFHSARVAVSPDGRLAAVGYDGGRSVQLYDWETGKLAQELALPTGAGFRNDGGVAWLAFARDGKALAGGGPRGLVVWDLPDGRRRWADSNRGSRVRHGVWSDDGSRLFVGGEDRTVAVWDAVGGEPIRRLLGHTAAIEAVCAVGPDAVFSGGDDRVQAWRADVAEEPRRLATGKTCWMNDVRYAMPDGRLVTVSGSDNALRVWDAAGAAIVSDFRGPATLMTLALDAAGRTVATLGEDNTVQLWSLPDQRMGRTLRGPPVGLVGLALEPAGRWVASSGCDGQLRVWDISSGRLLRNLPNGATAPRKPTFGNNRLAVSPDGRWLALASDDGDIRLWDATTWAEARPLRFGTASRASLAFSPDGRRLAGCGDGQLHLWDFASGRAQWVKSIGHTGMNAVAFFPDGKRLITGCGRWATPGEVKVWDADTGETTLTLRGMGGEVYGVAVRPDGGAIAAVTHEGTVRVWSLPSARQEAAEQYRRGRELLEARNWPAAIAALRRAAELDPAKPAPQRDLAAAHRGAGDRPATLAALRAAVALDPADADTHHDLAHEWDHAGDVPAAVAAFREAVRLDPRAKHSLCLADVLEEAGRTGEHLAALRDAVTREPGHAIAVARLGRLLARSPATAAEGVAALRKAVELNPKYALAHHELGLALRDAGELAEAVAALKLAVQHAPATAEYAAALRDTEAWSGYRGRLAGLAAGTDRPADAAEAAKLAAFCASTAVGRHDLAHQLYKQAFAADPTLATAHRLQRAAVAAARTDARADALGWLTAALAKPGIGLAELAWWQSDPTLATVRDVGKMTGAERAGWEKLWAEVATRTAPRPEVAPMPRAVP